MPALRASAHRSSGPGGVKLWLDAHIAPAIAPWLKSEYGIEASAVRDLGLLDAEDADIFNAAREAGACVMTKDQDFVELVHRLGAPPSVVWLTCGNCSTKRLKEILSVALQDAIALVEAGEALVEITDRPPASG